MAKTAGQGTNAGVPNVGLDRDSHVTHTAHKGVVGGEYPLVKMVGRQGLEP
jgi:hypothetical protein